MEKDKQRPASPAEFALRETRNWTALFAVAFAFFVPTVAAGLGAFSLASHEMYQSTRSARVESNKIIKDNKEEVKKK